MLQSSLSHLALHISYTSLDSWFGALRGQIWLPALGVQHPPKHQHYQYINYVEPPLPLTVPLPWRRGLLLSRHQYIAVVISKLGRAFSIRLCLRIFPTLNVVTNTCGTVTCAHDAGVHLLRVADGGEGEDDGQESAGEDHVECNWIWLYGQTDNAPKS